MEKSINDNIRNQGLTCIALLLFLFTIWISAACRPEESVPQEEASLFDLRPEQVVGIGRVEPEARFLDLSSEVAGIVTKIHFAAGEMVKRGEIMIELDGSLEKARLDLAEARVKTQPSQINAAEAALAEARIKAENFRLTFERAKSLFEQNAQTQAYFETAKTDYEALLEEVKRLEANLATARKLLGQYQAELKLARAELDRKFIKARTDGQILSLKITQGSLVNPEISFGLFAPSGPIVARCEIDELFAQEVKAGQEAAIRYPGTTNSLTRGTVTFVSPYLSQKSLFSEEVGELEDRRVREVWITLEASEELPLGSRIECVIRVKK